MSACKMMKSVPEDGTVLVRATCVPNSTTPDVYSQPEADYRNDQNLRGSRRAGRLFLYLEGPGDRLAYYEIADVLWGKAANVDSDGDSRNPDDTQWTEVSLILRGRNKKDEVYVDPVSVKPLVLKIRSPDREITKRVAAYLQEFAGGVVSQQPAKLP